MKAIRDRQPESAIAGVLALTAVDADCVDERDLASAAGLVWFALDRIGANASAIFVDASARACSKTRAILERMGPHPESPFWFGVRPVDTDDGVVFLHDYQARYSPTIDLSPLILRVRDLLEDDGYSTHVCVASDLSDYWVRCGDAVQTAKAIAGLSGTAHVSGYPPKIGKSRLETLLIFISEAASEVDAATIASGVTPRDKEGFCGVGFAERDLCLVVIARELPTSPPSLRASAVFTRFEPRLRDLLHAAAA